ncbi:MAG: SH3 domain-containing protein [Candidatus Sumerlaeia bacterium]|nr:SH3 domain-containing protein [Candidatus Sumerlaeia bacterium]
MKDWIKIIAAGLLVASPMMLAAQQTLYVKTTDAELRSQQGSGGTLVAKVPQNTKLTVLRQAGLFYQVRTADGKEGFISKIKVQDSSVGGGGGGLGGLVKDDRQLTTMRSQSVNRGVAPQTQEQVTAGLLPEQAVAMHTETEKLANAITTAEVDAFAVAGGLK